MVVLGGLLGACASTEEPEPRHKPKAQAVPEGLRALDRMLSSGKVAPGQSAAQRQRQCLARVAASPLCPAPAAGTRTLRLRLLLDERLAQRDPAWQQRLENTLACVNRFFAPAGLRWEVASVEGWDPAPARGSPRADREQLARLRPPDLKSLVVGVVVWDRSRLKPKRGSRRLASCYDGVCAFATWLRMETDCLTWAKNLARQVGAKLMPGRRWLVSVKYLRYLGLRGQSSMLHQHYRLHPRNLAALKLARAARYTPQGLRLPQDCYRRLRELDRCYFGGAPMAVTQDAACKRGKASACRQLGNLYARGHGVARDMVVAADYYRRACDGADMAGCKLLAQLYSMGVGVVRDAKKAAALLQRACQGANLLACVDLAAAYKSGRGVARDLNRAYALTARACQGKLMTGCNGQAYLLARGLGAPRDPARAAALYRLSCNSGDLHGCHSLALMAWRGQGIPRNRATAVSLLREGCRRGNARSCNSLASFVWSGRQGQRKDLPAALSLYARACEGGYRKACVSVGYMHMTGLGTRRDPARAAPFFARGCKGNNARGCRYLANLHLSGKAPASTPAEADRLLARCCARGSGYCCHDLARELRSGARGPGGKH